MNDITYSNAYILFVSIDTKMKPALLVYLASQKKKKIRQKNEYEYSIKQLEKQAPVTIG